MFVLQVYVDMLLIQQNFYLAKVTVRTWVVKPATTPSILKIDIYTEVKSHIKHLFKIIWMQADLKICVVWWIPFLKQTIN